MRPFVIALSVMVTLAPLAAAGDKKPNPFSFGLPKQEQKKEAPPAKVEQPAAKTQPPQQETPPAAPEAPGEAGAAAPAAKNAAEEPVEAPAEDTPPEAEPEPVAAPVIADENPQVVPVDASVAPTEVVPVEANDAPAAVTPAVAVKETEAVTALAPAPKTGAPAKSVAQRSTSSTFQFQLPDDASAPGDPTEKAPKEKPKKKTFGFQLPGS